MGPAGDGRLPDGQYHHVARGQADSRMTRNASLRIRPTLSFRDGQAGDFDKLMEGAKAGDNDLGKVELTQDAPNEALRGKKVDVEFEVLEVKKLKLPELTEDFLQEMGGFRIGRAASRCDSSRPSAAARVRTAAEDPPANHR